MIESSSLTLVSPTLDKSSLQSYLDVCLAAVEQFDTNELKKLRRYLSQEVVILVGGRVAESYSDILDEIGAIGLQDLLSFRAKLESLRSQRFPR